MRRIIVGVIITTIWIVPCLGRDDSTENEEKLKCANLIYAVSKSSVCFSDHFLATVSRETNCQPEQKFTPVKLAEDDAFRFPFAIMTGEGGFSLTGRERHVLKSYLTRGGFLLASAGCSSGLVGQRLPGPWPPVRSSPGLSQRSWWKPLPGFRTRPAWEWFVVARRVGAPW